MGYYTVDTGAVEVTTDGCCGWWWECAACGQKEMGWSDEAPCAAHAAKHWSQHAAEA